MSYDFYDLLGVDDDATQDEIKSAFRDRVRRYHPDHNEDERAPAQFTALKKGYDVLKDPEKRAAYDRMGHGEYVSKRMDGLPDPQKWAPAGEDDAQATASSSRGSAGSTSSQSTTGSASSQSTAGSTTSRSAAGSSSRSTASSTSRSSSSRSATRTSGRSARASAAGSAGGTANAASGGATSAPNGGTTGSTRGGSGAAGSRARGNRYGRRETGLRARLKRFNVGWPLVFLSVALYVYGLADFAEANRAGVDALRAALVAAGTDPSALQTVLLDGRYGIETLWAFARGTAPGVVPPGSSAPALLALAFAVPGAVSGLSRVARRLFDRPTYLAEVFAVMAAGAASGYVVGGAAMVGVVVLPVIFLVIVHITRETNPRWTPNWGYVVCAAAPAVGLGVQSVGGVTGVYVDVFCYGVLPVLSIAALLASAGVRRVSRAVREYRR